MQLASSHTAAARQACTFHTGYFLGTSSSRTGNSLETLASWAAVRAITAPIALAGHAASYHAPYHAPIPGRSLACPAVQPAVAPSTAAPQPQLEFQDTDWRDAFCTAAQAAGSDSEFVELTFKGKISPKLPYRQVVVRPVQLKAGTQLQFSYFGERQNVVKNATPGSGQAQERLEKLLHGLPFSSVSLKTTLQDVSVQLTKSGKAIVHRSARAAPRGPIQMGHDRRKGLPIPPDVAHPFLQKIGMQTADGRLKADMVDKMAQVNDFLKLLGHTGILQTMQHAGGADTSGSPVVRVLDAGCGSSHLTFGTWHYLNNVLGLHAQLVGVDSNAALMAKCNSYCRELGLTGAQASFVPSSILNYQSEQPPHVVLALHACDTATDEALALAVKQRASVIMAVPCCHKHLHRQLAGAKGLAIDPLQPLMRQGIMRRRTLDLVTDTFRAQLLRILGYKTDVVEFVSTEHTPRNLLIRAVLQQPEASSLPGQQQQDAQQQDADQHQEVRPRSSGLQQQFVEEYQALKSFWGQSTPYLETLLQDELAPYLLNSV